MQAEGHLGGGAEDIKTAPFILKLGTGAHLISVLYLTETLS